MTNTPNDRPHPDELFEHFVEASEDFLSVIDTEGRLLWVNRACRHVYGLEQESCQGHSAFDFVHADDRSAARAAFQTWVDNDAANAFQYEKRLIARDGTEFELLWVVEPIREANGELFGFATSARDITDRKRAERALQASEAEQRAILASVLDPTITIDGIGTILSASDSVRDVFGYEPEELIDANVRILMSEPHHSSHDQYLENYRRTGETNILGLTREFEVLRKDGTLIICDLSVSRADVPGQNEPVFTGSFRDVTQRKAAERALRESERRFRAIFDQEFQYVGLLRIDGRVLLMNRTSLDAAGVDHSDVEGQFFWETPWWPNDTERDRLRDAVARAARGEFVRFECELVTTQNSQRWIDFSLKPIQDDAGRVILLLPEGRDITEIRRVQMAEKRMYASLAEIGESASILAHEIKNPITGLNLALRAVADKLGEDQEVVLRDLLARMERLEQMMRRTLSFAKPIELNESRCNAQALCIQARDEILPEIASQPVEVVLDLPEEPLEFTGDAVLLGEVMSNLVRNAAQALEGKGRVVVTMHGPNRAHRNEIVVTVEDDGAGILASVRENLFKPFVTTKADGTGLGLPICRKIVEAHHGTIEVSDSEHGGARFEIRLPINK